MCELVANTTAALTRPRSHLLAPTLQVANTTGDVRRALELLRRAVEIADEERQKAAAAAASTAAAAAGSGQGSGQEPGQGSGAGAGGGATAAGSGAGAAGAGVVNPQHVNRAVNEMFCSTHMQLLRGCCRLDRLVLSAVLLEVRASGRQDVVLQVHLCVVGGECTGWGDKSPVAQPKIRAQGKRPGA